MEMSITHLSCYGDQTHAPDLSGVKNGFGESWDMWKAIAAQAKNGEYGNPDKFCSDVDATNWMSATVATSDDEIIRYIMNICKRDPRMGKVTTGGIVTVKDSTENWYLSWTINRQPQFKSQDKNMVLVWLYSLNTNKEGNYVKKAMRDCTGEEICREWLYHIGVPTERINALAKNSCNTTTCYMPYINAFFQPRKESDRPKVVPDGAVNFAFIGQFAETPRDTIFTTEYSMRTGMESVYTLLDIDRGVPEVWGSKYDVRELLRACYYAIDKKPITDIKLSFKEKMLLKVVMKKAKGTDVELQRVGLRITFFLCHLDGLAERHVCADLIKDIVQSSTEYRFYLQNLITTVYQVIDGIDNRQPRTYICLEQELHPPPAGYLFGSGCIVGNGTGNLFGANIQSFAGIAFGLGFTDTDNRFQTVFMSGARFLLNNFVDFTMIGAALGVTENNIRAADFLNHGRADVSGVGAFVFPMAVLSTEGNLGTAQRLFNRSQQRCRRTDQKFTFGFADFFNFCGNFLSQFNTVSLPPWLPHSVLELWQRAIITSRWAKS